MRLANKLRVLLQIQRGFLFQYGWLRSWWVGRPVDAAGKPLPWITYPAIDFLSQLDFSTASVFEWGSGFSTLWWVPRCKHVTTVESNVAWVPYIKTLLPPSANLIVSPFEVVAEVATLTGNPDVIVIDNHGPFRWRCAEAAISHLADGGLIILDNSDQCLKACAVLRNAGFTQIDFTGFIPGNGYAGATSVFFKSSFKFKTRDDRQPAMGPAQPNPPWPNC